MPAPTAIIFDLGGVLLDLDYSRTRKAFEDLGVKDFDGYYTQFRANSLFEDLETGRVSDEAFFHALREQSGMPLGDDQIVAAWNAMLLGFPAVHAEYLKALRERYRIFLLSNTNAIHYRAFQALFRESTGLSSLDDCFERAYYSHKMGQRKPWPAAYQMVLDEQGLEAGKTLFIDDTLVNVEGARAVGIRSVHLKAPQTLESLSL